MSIFVAQSRLPALRGPPWRAEAGILATGTRIMITCNPIIFTGYNPGRAIINETSLSMNPRENIIVTDFCSWEVRFSCSGW